MAHVDVSELSKPEHDSLACGYAALLLHDDGLEITVTPSFLTFLREKKLEKFLMQVVTRLNHTGHQCSLKLFKVKTLRNSSQLSPQLQLLLQAPQLLLLKLPLLKQKLPNLVS